MHLTTEFKTHKAKKTNVKAVDNLVIIVGDTNTFPSQ